MLFDICQMLNEINRGYLPQKGIKGILKHEDTKEHEVLFDRIYRMIRIPGVEGASRESRCDSLWIKSALAFVVQAPAGQICLAPATLSPCEAWFG